MRSCEASAPAGPNAKRAILACGNDATVFPTHSHIGDCARMPAEHWFFRSSVRPMCDHLLRVTDDERALILTAEDDALRVGRVCYGKQTVVRIAPMVLGSASRS
jgi:hypothetical protein